MKNNIQLDRARVDFAARKANAALSNAELARRTSLTVNTIKAYLNGDPVRESTRQRLHEALDQYIAEKSGAAVADAKSTQDALFHLRSFRKLLEDKMDEGIKKAQELDPVLRRQIAFEMRMINAMLATD